MKPSFDILVDVEDELQGEICKRLLSSFNGKFKINGDYQVHRNSKGGLKTDAEEFNRTAAEGNVRLVLMDLDSLENKQTCPTSEIKRMLRSQPKENNLLLRFAVWEAESWLLADWQNLKRFLELKDVDFSGQPDELPNAKERLHELVRSGSGKSFSEINKQLYSFTREKWNPQRAAKHSKSLRRTLARLENFPNP